ncbi:MAG: hypothetical protein AVDCRST_MAG25-2467, partial [uncultured Rubrobacteraceae bacterium]
LRCQRRRGGGRRMPAGAGARPRSSRRARRPGGHELRRRSPPLPRILRRPPGDGDLPDAPALPGRLAHRAQTLGGLERPDRRLRATRLHRRRGL